MTLSGSDDQGSIKPYIYQGYLKSHLRDLKPPYKPYRAFLVCSDLGSGDSRVQGFLRKGVRTVGSEGGRFRGLQLGPGGRS